MGCFFGCFGIKDSPSSHVDHQLSRNQLASAFFCSSATTPSGKGSVESDRKYRTSYEKELRNEVKLLKECGAIMNTPAELQRRSDRKENSPSGSTSSRQNKQLSASSADLYDSARSEERRRRRETLGWYLDRGVDVDYQPRTPGDVFVSSEVLGFNGQSCAGCSPSGSCSVTKLRQGNSKCVHFFSNEKSADKFQGDSKNQSHVWKKFSPNPTPLKLTDEMQTPGTVYANLENFANGKSNRVRTQFVYPVMRPIENLSHWRALKDNFNSEETSEYGQLNQSDWSPEIDTDVYWSSAAAESGGSCTDGQREALRFPGSKPSASGAESRNGTGGSSGGKNVDRERPIIGMVAAHWNEQLLEAEVSPKKEWDGKGIPNSTNKYKEDQTVNFHATPFEERLEKALCDDRFFPTRGMIDLDENEVL